MAHRRTTKRDTPAKLAVRMRNSPMQNLMRSDLPAEIMDRIIRRSRLAAVQADTTLQPETVSIKFVSLIGICNVHQIETEIVSFRMQHDPPASFQFVPRGLPPVRPV